MTSIWLVLALAFGLVAAAIGVLLLGARGEGGPAVRGDREGPPEDDAGT